MKHLTFMRVAALAFALVAGVSLSYAQATFKVPFKFDAGGTKLPAGEYWLAPAAEGQLSLRQESTGKEFKIPFTKRLTQPTPPVQEPVLDFDMVGNFEPSYTEYMTDYILAEIWLPGQDGYLIHITKGAHQQKVIKGQLVKK